MTYEGTSSKQLTVLLLALADDVIFSFELDLLFDFFGYLFE